MPEPTCMLLADDFTGACDTGLQSVRAGLSARVQVSGSVPTVSLPLARVRAGSANSHTRRQLDRLRREPHTCEIAVSTTDNPPVPRCPGKPRFGGRRRRVYTICPRPRGRPRRGPARRAPPGCRSEMTVNPDPDTLPLLALTQGDPCGVGAEIIVRALADPALRQVCRPVAIGHPELLARADRARNGEPPT